MMRSRTLPVAVLALLALPTAASAQVIYVAPPPPPPIPPPVYIAPGAMPPHVYIRERIRWHLRHLPRVVIGAPPVYVAPPPPVYIAPPLPPAPPPPAPIYAQPEVMPLPPVPPPIIVAPPCCYGAPVAAPAPELVIAQPRPVVPMWTSRIGLGVRGTGTVVDNGWNNLGIGGELLFRASPHLVTELAAEYDRSATTPLDRTDIPVTLGLRVHIGRPNWVVSPYFVFAGGLDFASEDLRHTKDDAIYVDGQIGGGLELRLGQHVAITADARLDLKKRADSPSAAVAATTFLDGKPVGPLGDEVGGQFRLGAAVYF
jgi:hypothetical protein